MSTQDIIHAWTNEEYRQSLSEDAIASLPEHPAGLIELTDEALDELLVQGGMQSNGSCILLSCNGN